jgi:hypothetical protein
MSAFKRSAVSVGTSDMSPPDVGSSIGPISLHNAIVTLGLSEGTAGKPSVAMVRWVRNAVLGRS